MSDQAGLTHDSVLRRHTDALRLQVGLRRRYSVAALAAACDVPPRTIEAYQGGASVPGLDNWLRLAAVLPAAYAAAVLEPAGFRPLPLDVVGACDFSTAADLAAGMAAVAEALRDGRIDHVERARLKPVMAELAAALAAWAAEDQVAGKPAGRSS